MPFSKSHNETSDELELVARVCRTFFPLPSAFFTPRLTGETLSLAEEPPMSTEPTIRHNYSLATKTTTTMNSPGGRSIDRSFRPLAAAAGGQLKQEVQLVPLCSSLAATAGAVCRCGAIIEPLVCAKPPSTLELTIESDCCAGQLK